MTDPVPEPDDELVCICHEVARGRIRALAEQLRSFDAVVAQSGICQTCQGCESEIRRIIDEVLRR